jgi:hypothetical protein
VCVQDTGSLDRFNRLRQTLQRLGLAALAKVWYTLNQTSGHFLNPLASLLQ